MTYSRTILSFLGNKPIDQQIETVYRASLNPKVYEGELTTVDIERKNLEDELTRLREERVAGLFSKMSIEDKEEIFGIVFHPQKDING